MSQGVVSASDLDEIMRASLGPRWAVGGVFEMYNFGGGVKGMQGFLENIGGAIESVWRDADAGRRIGMDDEEDGWKTIVTEQTMEAYGVPGPEDVRRRDKGLREVVRVQEEMERRGEAGKEKGGRGRITRHGEQAADGHRKALLLFIRGTSTLKGRRHPGE